MLGGMHGEGSTCPESEVTVHAEERQLLVMLGKVYPLILKVSHLKTEYHLTLMYARSKLCRDIPQ